jgi:hypothetical protein
MYFHTIHDDLGAIRRMRITEDEGVTRMIKNRNRTKSLD